MGWNGGVHARNARLTSNRKTGELSWGRIVCWA